MSQESSPADDAFEQQQRILQQGRQAVTAAMELPFRQAAQLQRNAAEFLMNGLDLAESTERMGTDMTRAMFRSYLEASEAALSQGERQIRSQGMGQTQEGAQSAGGPQQAPTPGATQPTMGSPGQQPAMSPQQAQPPAGPGMQQMGPGGPPMGPPPQQQPPAGSQAPQGQQAPPGQQSGPSQSQQPRPGQRAPSPPGQQEPAERTGAGGGRPPEDEPRPGPAPPR